MVGSDSRGEARRDRAATAGETGFSLIELLVGVLVSILVLGAATVMTKQVQEGYGVQLDTASAEQEARYALDWIQRLLRQAGSDPYNIRTSAHNYPPCMPAGLFPSVNGFPPVMRDPLGHAADDNIRIFADVGPLNGLLGGPGPAPAGCTERGEDMTVNFDAVNGFITLTDNNQAGVGAVVMTDSVISGLRFLYFDRNHVVTTDMTRLAWVTASVSARTRQRDPHTGQFQTFTATADVRLRPRW